MTLDSLTTHAESTSSTLLYALLSLPPTTPTTPSTLFHSASHLGTAQTLTTLLRALPFHAAHRRMVIPSEITARHALAHEDVFRTGAGEPRGLRDAVWEVASVAREQVCAARAVFEEWGGKVPKEAMPVFLAAVRVEVRVCVALIDPTPAPCVVGCACVVLGALGEEEF
jgi:NADH dehydrogenase [ubiquinone] 1 alpha subcomplex assembly factor 6